MVLSTALFFLFGVSSPWLSLPARCQLLGTCGGAAAKLLLLILLSGGGRLQMACAPCGYDPVPAATTPHLALHKTRFMRCCSICTCMSPWC
eukprot:38231-Chlamydomonas_euryale.AAC.4